jgi:hypothetical protein
MSQSTAVRTTAVRTTAVRTTARPATRAIPRQAPHKARLRVVATPPQARSRAGLVFGCLSLLVAGLVGLLLLNVNLERGAYQLRADQARAAHLQEQRQALQEELAALQAPQNLAAAATRLGMVRNPNASFIRGSDGKVLGVPQQAAPAPSPSVTEAPAKKKPGASPPKASAPPKAPAKKPAPSSTP